MIAKIVFLFLAAIAVLGMFGKWRLPGSKQLAARKCPNCGRYKIGKSGCDCGRKSG